MFYDMAVSLVVMVGDHRYLHKECTLTQLLFTALNLHPPLQASHSTFCRNCVLPLFKVPKLSEPVRQLIIPM